MFFSKCSTLDKFLLPHLFCLHDFIAKTFPSLLDLSQSDCGPIPPPILLLNPQFPVQVIMSFSFKFYFVTSDTSIKLL